MLRIVNTFNTYIITIYLFIGSDNSLLILHEQVDPQLHLSTARFILISCSTSKNGTQSPEESLAKILILGSGPMKTVDNHACTAALIFQKLNERNYLKKLKFVEQFQH